MPLRLYNTLTRSIEPFTPADPDNVRMFVCGPTVYDYIQIGNARTFIQMDILARVIRANGYTLTYLQNITDIDDKIIARAAERDIDWTELRDTYEAAYLEDVATINITSIDRYARATDHIDDIIRQVQTLIDKGHAYVIDGDGIYFEIATFPAYGKLSGRTELKEDDAQSRIDQSDGKRGWNDFALWKFSKPGEPVWDAPFGAGRPGWHIEDTAITEHFFGPQYDLHGGGIDLIFPHHEAEITQMESASGLVPFVRLWTHVSFLTVDGRRMGKSMGNFHTLRDVTETHDPMALRMLMLQAHYRSSLDFSWESLEAAGNRLRHWRAIAALRHQTHDTLQDDDEKARDEHAVSLYATSQAIVEALSDDLDTPETLKIIDDAFSRLEHARLEDIHQHALHQLLERIDETLGLGLVAATPDISDEAKRLILERQVARDQKNWSRSDQLRDELLAQHIMVRDTAHGPVWEYV